jgi:hypothetical protein
MHIMTLKTGQVIELNAGIFITPMIANLLTVAFSANLALLFLVL